MYALFFSEWRRPPYPVHTADYATYVQILTWFFDSPSPEAPFSVHRMALAGKELGKDVGQWFGPSTAAGAIKYVYSHLLIFQRVYMRNARTLLAGYPEAGLGASVATDGVLFQTDVFAASNGRGISRSPKRHVGIAWGDRPVLLLIGVRLGIDGVNPIYYETIKVRSSLSIAIMKLIVVAVIHVPAIGGHRRRPPKFIVLLCRLSG